MVSIRVVAATLGLLASTAAFADDPLPRTKINALVYQAIID
jgi:hypothetical protein